MSILQLQKVCKQFPGHRAVDEVSLDVQKGEFFSLLGPSGCGKTTTLRLIAGFEQPTSGRILLNGAPIDGLPPYRRNVSTVFQNYALFPHLTVKGNIEFGLRRRGLQDTSKPVGEMLDLFQLHGKEDRYPTQISGGERQRVALARSLVLQPDVLLLDEPLSALDPNLRKTVRAELKTLQRRTGVTFVFVTHDQEEALSMSDRIAVVSKGRLEQTGTPRELYLAPKTRFVAGFLGAVNWIEEIGVRPESTHIARAPRDGSRAVPGIVENTVFLGNRLQIEMRLTTGQSVVAEVSRHDEEVKQGDKVHIWWRPEDEMALPQSQL